MSRFKNMSEADIDVALTTAQALSKEADDLHRQGHGGLSAGGPPSGVSQVSTSGRVGLKGLATARWVGEARDEFEATLFAHEIASLDETVRRLRDEADDWAGFWQTAINERNQALFEDRTEALQDRRNDWSNSLDPEDDAGPDPPSWFFGSPTPPPQYPRPLPPDYQRPAAM